MKRLNQEVLNRLKTDEEFILRVAQGMNKKIRTIREWIRTDDDENLTSLAFLLVIEKLTGLKQEEIIVLEKQEV